MGLEALTKLLRNEEADEEGRAEPRAGTTLCLAVVEEKPRPCLNLAAPSPLRTSSL